MKRLGRFGLPLALCTLSTAAFPQARGMDEYVNDLPRNHPAIAYSSTSPEDAIAECKTASDIDWGLKATTAGKRLALLLDLLDVNSDSQTLVFSKTSFQSAFISPRNPRAIYFNDRLTVGYVRGSPIVEVSALDRRGGNQFYTVDLSAGRGSFTRQEVCLRCHQGVATQGVPGTFVGSVYPSSNGRAATEGAIITDHRSAFQDRWGGWYVNAKAGEQADRANATAPNPVAAAVLETGTNRRNIPSLLGRFDTQGYLSGVSDVVALMTLEHQTQAANLISRLSWLARISESTSPPDPDSQRRVSVAVEDLLHYLLFVDEQRLKEPIVGVSTFAETFPKRGPYDRHGRSLRDFDLKTRLFKFPLSYMIYSPSFDAIPQQARRRFYVRLQEVLSGSDESGTFARIPREIRADIASVLRDTKPEAMFDKAAP